MVECVQNHTPAVMVIDEIGRSAEVRAALTCKERGVRMIASAHGDLAGLVRNSQLCDLVGGVDVVTIGDQTARQESHHRHGENITGSKLRAERRGPPIFDVVIELLRGKLHQWRLVHPSAAAVDSILSLGRYEAQLRSRDESLAGRLRLQNIRVDANKGHIIEEASSRESPLLQNKFPRLKMNGDNDQKVHLEDLDPHSTDCPCCSRTFRARKDMLNHVLGKRNCMQRLESNAFHLLQDEKFRLAYNL